MSGLKLFYDAFSQPSRAVFMLLELGNIPYQSCLVNIAKGENRTNGEFLEASPNKTVPAIDDNGFKLFESSAIMKYLVAKHALPDHWYPRDVAKRAKIDEYLYWHGSNMRLGAASFMFYKFIYPRMTGSETDEKKIQEAQQLLDKSMKVLDNYYLKDTKFINSSEVSIADIQAACEITQFWLADIDLCSNKPRLKNWMENVQTELNPAFDKAHKMVNLARSQGVFKSKL